MIKRLMRPQWPAIALVSALVMMLQPGLYGSANSDPGSLQESVSLTGQVTEASTGNPIPGVSIQVKGTTTGTITDADGNYSISVDQGDILIFSFVGYLTEEFSVGTETTLNITLAEDIIGLDEIVVIGYGVQKKSDLTGAIASVTVEDLQKIPNTGVGSMLQGMASGVQVSQNTGAPGSDVTIRVHGVPTLTSVNGVAQGQPIWIVDGVPASPNSVNPGDIQAIEILKDASSAAIYGSNGGAGVILITTKSGISGKPRVSLNYYHGWQSAPNKLDLASGPDFGKMYTEMEALRGLDNFTFPDYESMPTYDYQDLVFRSGKMDNLDFSVSGGNEKSDAYLGLGYVKQEGILEGTSFERFNVRINSNYDVNKWFKMGEKISFNYSKTPGFEQWQYQNEYESPLISAIGVHPYLAPYDETGNYIPNGLGEAGSPLPAIELLNKEFYKREGTGLVYIRITPVAGLAFETRLSGSLSFNNDYEFLPTFRFGSSPGQFRNISEIYRRMESSNSYNWQNILSYNTIIAKSFNVDVMAGYEVGKSYYTYMSGRRFSLLTEEPEMWYFDASIDESTPAQIINQQNGANESAGYAYFARLNLDYKRKYLLQANFRRDASSKFGPENRIGTFPGFSFGWKFSEEDFIKNNLGFLSFGKIRYGYGVAGVNSIDNYAYYATSAYLTHFSYSFDNSPTLISGGSPNVLVDKSIRWEEVVTQNFGVDLSFLNNRLTLAIDRFDRRNKGMLTRQTIPGYAGWIVRDITQEAAGTDPRPFVNIGNMVNKGWDFSAGWNSRIGDLSYSVDVIYSYVSTLAENLGADSIWSAGTARGLAGDITRTATGEAVSNFYGFKTDGIYGVEDSDSTRPDGTMFITNQPYTINANGDVVWAQRSAQPGDIRFVDVNDDGQINQDDRVILGNPFPKHELGITLNLAYKMFDFSMFWQGAFGYQIFNATKYYLYNNDGNFNWSKDFVDDHYRVTEITAVDAGGNTIAVFPENRGSTNPRLDPLNANNNFGRVSDFYIEDGSYLRLKNIQIGLTLPEKWLNMGGIEQFRIYVGGKNLLTFTKYSGMDPEVPIYEPLTAGIDKAAYPQARIFLAGVNLKF
jgi:TonB-linked SusC/RagA family outer membrane protein